MSRATASLWQRAMRGAFWGVAKSMAEQVIRFAVFVALARLLSPDDFGRMAVAVALTILADLLIAEGGWTKALVRRKRLPAIVLNSFFWGCLALSVPIAALSFVGALVYAHVLQIDGLVLLVLSLLPLFPLAALRIVPHALLIRSFDFRSIAVASNTALALAAVVAVGAAVADCGVWALVLYKLLADGGRTFGFLVKTRWRPRLAFSRRALFGDRGFIAYSSVAQLAHFVDYLISRTAIAGWFGTTAVGWFAIGVDLRRRLRGVVTIPATQVIMPSVKSLEHDPARLQAALAKGFGLLALLVFPVMVGAALISEDVVPLLLGEQWRPAVPLVELTLIAAAPMAVIRACKTVQFAYGNARLVAWLEVLSTSLFVALVSSVPVVTASDIVALLAIRTFAAMAVHLLFLARTVAIGASWVLTALLPSALATLLMAVAGLLVHSQMTGMGQHLRLSGTVLVAVVAYLASTTAFAPQLSRAALKVAGTLLERRMPSRDHGVGPDLRGSNANDRPDAAARRSVKVTPGSIV